MNAMPSQSREAYEAAAFLDRAATKAENQAGTLYSIGLACLLLGGAIAFFVGAATNLMTGLAIFASFIALRVLIGVLERLARIHACLARIHEEVSKK